MKNVKRLSLVLMCWILFCSVNVNTALGQEQKTPQSYTCQKIFTYGLWGYAPVPYELGLEGMVRTMRRHYMNCLVAAPKVTQGAAGLARLKRDVALCKKYGWGVSVISRAASPRRRGVEGRALYLRLVYP